MSTAAPLPSAPYSRCRVTHVHREDAEYPVPHRPVRTLVEVNDAPGVYLLPIRSDTFRLYGESIAPDPSDWLSLASPQVWVRERVPITNGGNPPVIQFISRSESIEDVLPQPSRLLSALDRDHGPRSSHSYCCTRARGPCIERPSSCNRSARGPAQADARSPVRSSLGRSFGRSRACWVRRMAAGRGRNACDK